jgi:flagellar hook-basal body complex protein FliE
MSVIPALRTAQALSAYQSTDSGISQSQPFGSATAGSAAGGTDFASLLNNSLNAAIGTGEQAEAQATGAIQGSGDLTQVVTAVSRAELALQTTVAVRDRVLQAYQDIIKMSI